MHAALKTLVIGLGVLIALGLGLLVYGFFKTSSDPTWRLFGDARPAAAPAGDIELNLPTGCEIKDVTQLGGQIYVLTQPAGVCGQVLIVDPTTGRVTGRIKP